MRTLATLVLTAITLIFLLFGYSYWKGQTNLSVKEQTQTNNSKEPTKETEKNNDLSLLDHVGKWPEHAIDDYRDALENGQAFKFAIVGSQVLAGEDGWAEQLKDEFKNIEKKEENQIIRNAVLELPSKHKDIILCVYFMDMSIKEAATCLNIKEGTAKSRLSRAKEKLRQILEGRI